MDVAHTRPSYQDKQGRLVPARFDTVLISIVDESDCESVGVSRTSFLALIKNISYKYMYILQDTVWRRFVRFSQSHLGISNCCRILLSRNTLLTLNG